MLNEMKLEVEIYNHITNVCKIEIMTFKIFKWFMESQKNCLGKYKINIL
jgi:hypothetical protein